MTRAPRGIRGIRSAAALLGALLAFLAVPGARESGAAQHRASAAAEAGVGYDDNVFLAPGANYFDPFADAIIEPRRRSGLFLPAKVAGGFRSSWDRLDLFADARAEMKRFLDQDLKNADTGKLAVGGGAELLLRERGGRRDTLRLRPSARWWRQTSFDRDTGEERATRDDEDLGEQSDYARYGLEARVRERTLPVRLELIGEVARYDYTEVPVLDSIDAVLSRLAAEVEFDAPARTRITLSGEHSRRDFDDRRSRNLEGNLVRGSDRAYHFSGAGVDVSREFRGRVTAGLGYERLRRIDAFAGYLDYLREKLRARLACRGEGGLRLRAEASWWRRDYPRAFAFDDPAFEGLSYEAWEVQLKGELPLRGRWKLLVEYDFTRQRSTDPRYDYGRHAVFAAVAAEL